MRFLNWMVWVQGGTVDRRIKRPGLLAVVSVGLTLFWLSPFAHAQPVTNWNVSTGDWTTSGNWDNGVPNLSTQALIGNNGTATISASDTAFALAVYVGQAGLPFTGHGVPSPGETGTLLMSGGTLTVSDGVQVGGDGGFTNIGSQAGDGGGGTLTVSSGALTVTSGGVNVGGNGGRGGLGFGGAGGSGTLTISSGALTVTSGDINVGGIGGNGAIGLGGAGGSGTLTISNGTLTLTSGGINVGGNGGGNQVGGVGGSGTLTISSGTLTLTSGGINVGGNGGSGNVGGDGANGTLALNGGTLTLSSGSIILGGVEGGGGGPGAGGSGTLNLDSGTLTATSIIVHSNGTINFTPGLGQTVIVNAAITGLSAINQIIGGTGTVDLNGTADFGSVTINTGAILQLGNGTTNGTAGTGTITDNGTLAFDLNGTQTVSNLITGGGVVNQLGGTTILAGTNTYNGGTTISGGTLQISADNNLGATSGGLTFNGGTLKTTATFTTARSIILEGGGGTFNTDSGTTLTATGNIAEVGSLTKIGAGTLTLSGANTYTGGTTIDSGTLIVDSAEALGTGNVTITGGVLTADPQPINVVGNYFQGPNGTLQLTIAGASAGQYDYLNVTGNASLGGTLKLINQNFTPQVGDTLTLVQAGGTISNKFATVIDPFTTRPGLNTIDLVYSLHSVDLEFLNITSVPPGSPLPPPRITTLNFASFAQTPNELAAGELLNAVELNPRFGSVLNLFLSQPFGDIPGDLTLISPEAFSSFYEISFSDANIQRLTLENRLDEIRAGLGSLNAASTEGGTVGLQKASGSYFAEASKDKDGKTTKNPVEPVLQAVRQPRFDLWASGFGDFVHVDSDYNARGYRFTTSGFDLGFDYRFLDHFAVGVMGNYTYTWTDLRPGTITVNSGRGGVYAGYFSGSYYLNAGVYGGSNTYDTSRHGLGGEATGNTDGQEWSGFLSTGYDFHHGDLTIGPIASLQYTNVYTYSFNETGSLVPLSIHSDSEESLRSDVGFRAFYQFHAGKAVVAPYLKATWEHEYKYSALPVTAGLAGFPGPDETFVGPVEGQDSAVISAGVSVQWTPAVSTYAGYDGQLGRGRYSSNAVNGGVRVSW